MKYNLFLDDQRFPKDVTWVKYKIPHVDWTIVRNYKEFVDVILDKGMPEMVSFDHDLEPDKIDGDILNLKSCKIIRSMTGYDCAKWLVDYCMKDNLPFPKYYVHSMNPVGKTNIEKYIENYKKMFDGYNN